MKSVILLDMDGVLVDFPAGAAAVHGVSAEELVARWEPGRWDLLEAFNCTMDEFWEPIHQAGERFWTALRPFAWVEPLVALVEQHASEWHIISAPSRCDSSYTGKVKWLKREFGRAFDRFALTPHKHLYAKPGTILIDDREINVERFREAGGEAIVFPSHGNSLHALKHDPLPFVREQLERYHASQIQEL